MWTERRCGSDRRPRDGHGHWFGGGDAAVETVTVTETVETTSGGGAALAVRQSVRYSRRSRIYGHA